MNIRFYLRFLVPFLLLQLISSITHCASTSTGNGEKGKIKNTATGRGGEGAQKIKPNNKSHGFHKMNETPSPAISPDLGGKMRNHRKTSPNVAHNQAIETNKAQVNKELGLISSCSVLTKEYCCKRVCQKRRPQQAQFPHNYGAHHQPSNNHHSSMIRVQRQADICATCLATMDDEGNCSCPAEAWQEPEPEVVEQPPPPVESDSLPEQVVPDYYAGDAVVPDS